MPQGNHMPFHDDERRFLQNHAMAERDARFVENQRLIADYFGLSERGVLDMLRRRKGLVLRLSVDDRGGSLERWGETEKKIKAVMDGAPAQTTDPEFAEWVSR